MQDVQASPEKRYNQGVKSVLQVERNAFPVRDEGLGVLCDAHGFDHYLLASFPRADRSGIMDGRLLSNWPIELLEVYDRADAFRRSDLIATLRRSALPAFADGSTLFRDAEDRDMAALPRAFSKPGFEKVLSFSLHDAAMEIYVVILSGRNPQMSGDRIMEIYFTAMRDLQRITTTVFSEEKPRERLTAREIECLRWSAAGKSSDEIAIILAISSHTVISYLKSAMRKLDAVSRMQAVARACRFRML